MLIIYFTSLNNDKITEDEIPGIINEYDKNSYDLISEMEAILSTIKGAGEVKVLVNYASSSEIVTATAMQKDSVTTYSDNDESSITENTVSEIVTVKDDNGENALVLKELMPEISGVIVTAQGAGDISVKMRLIDAVTTLLDIPQNKVDVFEMQNINMEERK